MCSVLTALSQYQVLLFAPYWSDVCVNKHSFHRQLLIEPESTVHGFQEFTFMLTTKGLKLISTKSESTNESSGVAANIMVDYTS